jgi:hypothetical protein
MIIHRASVFCPILRITQSSLTSSATPPFAAPSNVKENMSRISRHTYAHLSKLLSTPLHQLEAELIRDPIYRTQIGTTQATDLV